MNRSVLKLMEFVELTLSRADGQVPAADLSDAEAHMSGLRNRNGHFGEVLVVALAGGTGSGKSSLLNAIAGEAVAGVSVLRPHTQTPLAWIPRANAESVERLLDALDISQRIEQDVLPSVAFIDLPDIDSIADWHRQMVESLLPHVDAVLWVMDPEKYRDGVLHQDFLAPLAEFEEQFAFVMNKIDKLAPGDVDLVRGDLAAALLHDGFTRPIMFFLAADPPDGAPINVDRLVAFLSDRVDVKRVALGKAINDIAAVLRRLGEASGVWAGAAVDFESRWARAREASAAELPARRGPAARDDAVCRLEDLVAALAVDVGPLVGRILRDEFPSKRIESAVDDALALDGDAASRASRIESELGVPLRRLLWDRAEFAATLASAAVATRHLRARHVRT